MTRNSSKTLIAIASVLTVAGFAVIAQSGAASAKNVLSCKGAGRQSLIECCETAVLKHGLPMWMRQTGRNCQQVAVRCVGGSDDSALTHVVKKRCFFVAENQDNDNKRKRDHKSRDNGQTGGRPK